MKAFVICLLISLFSSAHAAIMPTRTILQKTSDNAGSGIYSIEQEVTFSVGEEVLSVKETWLIENERALRLSVTGNKELKDRFHLQFLYTGGQRWQIQNKSRVNSAIPEDFIEKFFNFRSSENFASALEQFKIIPSGAFAKKPAGRTGADFKHTAESWVRYSRTGGVVNYAFGTPTPAEQETPYPGLWIEQDQFVIRKLRLPSGAEVVADNYSQFSRGLSYPRVRTVQWGPHTASIRLISASSRPNTASSLLQPSSLDMPARVDGLDGRQARNAVLEFYSRFR